MNVALRVFAITAAVGALVAGCKDPDPPGEFGINLTISLGELSQADRARIVRATVHVGGDEVAQKILSMENFDGAEARTRFIPQNHSGMVDFVVVASDSSKVGVAFASSDPIMITDGPATPVRLVLHPAAPAGTTCTRDAECGTAGGCADGVCCSAVCGPCQNCGADGTCSAKVTSGNDTTGMPCLAPSVCDAAGQCSQPLGTACTADTACGSGHCTDGVCCEAAACDACRNCGATGKCDDIKVVSGEDATGCSGDRLCDDAGVCRLKLGSTCMVASAMECISGVCEQGTCCDRTCNGPCQTCTSAEAPGSCRSEVLVERPGCLIANNDARMCDPAGACQLPHLVADINTMGVSASNPTWFTDGPGGKVYFNAFDPVGNFELYSTDGTQAGTVQVADIIPGIVASNPHELRYVAGQLFFIANDLGNVARVYRTDGTQAGTTMVSNSLNPLSALVPLGNFLYFAANDPSTGVELYRTDGTDAGTVLVRDILPGPVGSQPQNLTVFGNKLLFTAGDTPSYALGNVIAGNVELWLSDGTELGTNVVADLSPGAASSGIGTIVSAGTQAFFAANTNPSTVGFELYVTDGSNAGTVLVKDILPGTTGSAPAEVTHIGNGKVLFRANDGVNGPELWKSDGTSAGTAMVKDIRSGATGSVPQNLALIGSQVYFAADDGTTGSEVWKSDGTPGGTVQVADVLAGVAGSTPTSFVPFANKVFFRANASAVIELWVTDGTAANTSRACGTGATACMAPGVLRAAGGRLWFGGDAVTGTQHGQEPYVFP